MILLDTHTLVWLVEGKPRLGVEAREIIERERSNGGALIAPITTWETAMLVGKGKVLLRRSVHGWFEAVLAAPGFALADMTAAIGVDAGSLPGDIHGDPADRIIVATARALGCPLLTADNKILAYAARGHVHAIDARR